MAYMSPYASLNYYQPYKQYGHQFLRKNKMKLIGVGYVKAQPNIAIVTLGVVTENKDLDTAREENSEETNEVIKALRKMGIDEMDIKTQAFTIIPEYDYIDGEKKFRGYRVQNMLNVTIREIENTGKIVDASVAAGANTVTDISFTVNNQQKYYLEALNKAVMNSIEKAKSIENILKITVNKTPIKIDEESRNSAPVVKSAYMEASQAVPPIEPGQLEFNAKVESVFSYENI